MKMEITKAFRFEAAHSLELCPPAHKCRGLHGHSYEIVVGVRGEMEDSLRWVQDYADISRAVEPVIALLDHRNLNVVMRTPQTTAEALALWLAEKIRGRLPMLSRIEVRETPTSNVILRLEP